MNLIYLTIFIYKMVLNGQKSLFLIIIWVCAKIFAVHPKIAVHHCTAICILNKQQGIHARTFWGKIKTSYSTTSHP